MTVGVLLFVNLYGHFRATKIARLRLEHITRHEDAINNFIDIAMNVRMQ